MIKGIKALLTEDEHVIRDTQIHWIVFASPILYLVMAFCVAVFFQPLVGAVILITSLYPIYTTVVSYVTTHLVLTDKKVMARTGFLNRIWVQIALDKIETADLVEPILGRDLDYSTVVITGTGIGRIAVPYIVDGDIFVKELQSKLLDKPKTVELEIEGEKFTRKSA